MLSKAMKKLHCTSATSVSSESACSLSAFLNRKERARLTEDNLSSSVRVFERQSRSLIYPSMYNYSFSVIWLFSSAFHNVSNQL